MRSAGPIRWGILGTGNINRKLVAGARRSEVVSVMAVASRSHERALKHAAEFGIPRAYGSYEELLADPTIEAVYVSLPNLLHHEWTMKALGVGKHVLCEKPYSRRPVEVVEAFDAAERGGLVLMEGFMWRHGPQTRRLLELLPEIGDLQGIRATFSFQLDDIADIRLRPELGGGSLMDVGCYCVSASRLLAGLEPERVYGESIFGPTGVDIRFMGMLRFPSGVIAEFTSGFTASHMSLEAIWSDGSICLPDPWHAISGVVVRDGTALQVEPEDQYRIELENMGAAIRGEAVPLLGREDALGQARAIDALYRSAETGTSVPL